MMLTSTVLRAGPGQLVEFLAQPDIDRLAETLVAFANGDGGTLIVGVDPHGKPLGGGARVLGTLGVGFGHDQPITEQEQSFLMLIGSQLGAAIENAQLYAEIQAQVQRITSLYELGKGLSGAIDTRSLLQVVRGEAAKAIPFDLFTYDLFNEDTGRFERVFAAGADSGLADEVTDLDASIQNVVKQRASYLGNTGQAGSIMAVPETRYAKSGDVHIAYRVFGNGPPDIVLVPGTVSHVELYWELPASAYLLKRLASFSRVIVFDCVTGVAIPASCTV